MKKINYLYRGSILYFFVILPFLLFGNNYYEEYSYALYSINIFIENLFNPLIFYYDLIGPGSKLPFGYSMINFFPPSYFASNNLIFYLFSLLIFIFFQVFYFKRLINILKFNDKFILYFIHIFSIVLFYNLFTKDYITQYFAFSFLPAIFFYSIKFIKFKKAVSFYKLVLIISYITINGHVAYNFIIYIFIISLFLINSSFFYLRKNYFYIGLLIGLLITSEEVYRLSLETLNYNNIPRIPKWSYDLKHIFSGFYTTLQLINDYLFDIKFITKFNFNHNAFLPFTGLIFYVGLYESVRLFLKNQSHKLFYINYLFIFFIIMSKLEIINAIQIISGPFFLRDIYVFISIFLFASYLTSLKSKKIANSIIIICFFITIGHYFQNVSLLKENKNFNFLKINNNYKNEKAYLELNKIKNINNLKTYLSPKMYEYFSPHRRTTEDDIQLFVRSNIFYITDLIKFNIHPFNYNFKSASKNQLIKPVNKMYSNIAPKYEDINDEIFFNLFKIGYLLIFESEINKVDLNRFEIIKVFKEKKDNIVILKLKNNYNITISAKKYELSKKLNCKEFEQVYCYLNAEIFSKSETIEFKRTKLNNYTIKNLSSETKRIVLPFLFDKNWITKEKKIYDVGKTLMIIDLLENQEIKIQYLDKIRTALKIISILSLLLLILLIVKKSKKKINE